MRALNPFALGICAVIFLVFAYSFWINAAR
jgi:hypothetical protein